MILRRLEGLRRIINAITPLLCLLLALSILSDFHKILKEPIASIRTAQSEISTIIEESSLTETLESVNAARTEIKWNINSINKITDTFIVPESFLFPGATIPIPGVKEIKTPFVSSLNDIDTVLEKISSLIEPLKSLDNKNLDSILGKLKVLLLVILAAILFPIPLYISWAGYQLRDGWRLFRGE